MERTMNPSARIQAGERIGEFASACSNRQLKELQAHLWLQLATRRQTEHEDMGLTGCQEPDYRASMSAPVMLDGCFSTGFISNERYHNVADPSLAGSGRSRFDGGN
jgi:hypothetical protein